MVSRSPTDSSSATRACSTTGPAAGSWHPGWHSTRRKAASPTSRFGPSVSQFGLIPAVELTTASSAYLLYRQSLSLQVAVIDGTPVAHNVTWVDQPNNASPSADNLPPDAEQPEGAPDLITGDDRLVSAVWRNGYIWAT